MKFAVTLLLSLALTGGCAASSELTVVSFNIWGAGANSGRSVAETAAVLETLDADVFALQEVRGESPECLADDCPPFGPSVAGELAAALGYHVYEQSEANDALWANAILSRYPIRTALGHDLGVIVDVGGRSVAVYNVHLPDYPYQPYQLTGIEYAGAPMLDDEESAIESALAARGAAVQRLLDAIGRTPATALTVVCGDFNEPSHLDWTERAAEIGRHPMKVGFPVSRMLANAGFADAYRESRRDEVAHPGFTWTPTTRTDDPTDHHDRIDFVYVKGAGARVVAAEVAGESPAAADIVVDPWPSDHRAVRVRLRF
jgi:endonuclease/exonuclease/phosphatase family metal-dependent hydrolase